MAKVHIPPPSKWKFKRSRNGTEHADHCEDGYVEPKNKKRNVLEIHHVLCVDACSNNSFPTDLSDDDVEFILICLANTAWNINAAPNNIGLPRKWAYVDDPSNTTKWDGLPCHQVDHNLYLDTVSAWMTKNVWKKMTSASKKEKCEYVEGKNVAELFELGSSEWKKFLTTRGKNRGGTMACLSFATSGATKPKDMNDHWHVPFSMSPDEEAIKTRVRPPANRRVAREDLLAMIK